jgi:hypothetical protein
MTRFAIIAVVLAALAGNALADSTYVLNDKQRRIYVPTPAPVAQEATGKAQPAVAADKPYALTGESRTPIVRHTNDKGRRID